MKQFKAIPGKGIVASKIVSNTKRYIKSSTSRWPSEDEWYSIETDEELEDMWSEYLGSVETEINTNLNISPEPSAYGGVGSMFICDESGQGRKSFEIDFQDWCNHEIEMAASSKSAQEYKEKYRAYIQSLIDEHWG